MTTPNHLVLPSTILGGALVVAALILAHDLKPPRYQLAVGPGGSVLVFNTRTGTWQPFDLVGNGHNAWRVGEPVEALRTP